MIFDSLMLRAALDEIAARAEGGEVVGVFPLERNSLLLKLRVPEPVKILISVEPAFARIHLSAEDNKGKLKLPFTQELRRRLGPARLDTVRQHGFERISEFCFSTVDDLGDPLKLRLVVELTGRHCNLFLLDEADRILLVMKSSSSSRTGTRHLVAGAQYELPPNSDLPPPWEVPFQKLRAQLLERPAAKLINTLQQLVAGGSAVLLGELMVRAGLETGLASSELDEAGWQRLEETLGWLKTLVAEGKWAPVVLSEPALKVQCYPIILLSLPAEWQHPAASLGEALDAVVGESRRELRFEAERKQLLAVIRERRKKAGKALEDILLQLERASEQDELKLKGDLLLTYGWRLPPETKLARLTDPASGKEIEVELEPTNSIARNAERYYTRYKKATRATKVLPARKQALEEELAALSRLEAEIETASAGSELQALGRRLGATAKGSGPKTPERKDRARLDKLGIAPRNYESPGGFEVLVGRSAAENDALTFKYAAQDDLWFHSRGTEGSHVLLRTEGRPERAQLKDLEFAAKLAAEFSKDRHSGLVPVDYTLRKYVRKIKGGGPGAAFYTHEKTLFVEPG